MFLGAPTRLEKWVRQGTKTLAHGKSRPGQTIQNVSDPLGRRETGHVTAPFLDAPSQTAHERTQSLARIRSQGSLIGPNQHEGCFELADRARFPAQTAQPPACAFHLPHVEHRSPETQRFGKTPAGDAQVVKRFRIIAFADAARRRGKEGFATSEIGLDTDGKTQTSVF